MSGKLYICPTPIGNLEDITLRTVRVLGEADLIACEDTRHTLKLLSHLGISKKLVSYHEHNKKSSGTRLLYDLEQGMNIALVSDAGMPGISDPGFDIISLCIENEIEFEILPGPSAFVNALLRSGFNTERFTFIGFLDRTSSKRKQALEEVKDRNEVTILYEAPHRLADTLSDINSVIPERSICVAREITKRYEEAIRGTASEILEICESREIKGEIVIVIDRAPEREKASEQDIKSELEKCISSGMTKKDASKLVAKKLGISKNEAYRISLDI